MVAALAQESANDGFVLSRNVLITIVMSFAAIALVSLLWVLFGCSLAFSPGHGTLAPFSGGLQWAGLSGLDFASGLVAITPAAGFVSPLGAVVIGFAARPWCSRTASASTTPSMCCRCTASRVWRQSCSRAVRRQCWGPSGP